MSGLVGWMRIFEIASESREADVRPGLAGVGRLVDAVARHDVAADARLAHADVDDVGVRFGDGDGADRRARDLAVGDRRPASRRRRSSSTGRRRPRRSTPPSAVPSRRTTAIDRPPRSGPMLRHLKALTSAGSSVPSAPPIAPRASGRGPKVPSGRQRQHAGADDERANSGQADHDAQPPRERNESSTDIHSCE